jgi:predicted metal-dependent hydrolase
MNEALKIDDLAFEVRRSKRRKTIGLTVDRDASLIAHLPEVASLEEASELIKSKLVWILQKLASHGKAPDRNVLRRPEFVDGEGFYFLGRHYRLKLVDPKPAEASIPTVRFEGDRLLFRREQVNAGEKRIAEYYTRAANPYLNDAVARWKPVLGVTPARFIHVMDLGFRWGSCSADGTLNFHWRVMQLPPQVIDYIVVHELAHLKVSDHSPAFWKEVGNALPEFRRHRGWLREKGGSL